MIPEFRTEGRKGIIQKEEVQKAEGGILTIHFIDYEFRVPRSEAGKQKSERRSVEGGKRNTDNSLRQAFEFPGFDEVN